MSSLKFYTYKYIVDYKEHNPTRLVLSSEFYLEFTIIKILNPQEYKNMRILYKYRFILYTIIKEIILYNT